MKRLSVEWKARQLRIKQYRETSRRRRNGKLRRANYLKYEKPGEVIFAPLNFNLTQGDGVEVVKFLRAVAVAVLKENRVVKLNFTYTEHFAVPGTILLFSELDRIITSSSLPKPITLIEPFRRRPREVMKQIGLFNLTNDRSDIVPEREDVVYWKATKGSNQSGDSYGSLVEALAERVNAAYVKQIEVGGLWRSVNEAIANSIDHAYKKPRADGFVGLDGTKWWMFSQIKDGILTLAVCDLGCGYRSTIEETIPEKFIANWAVQLKRHNRDARAIATAMEYGRSGTHESHRGKGSRDVLSLLEKHGEGTLVVLSNTGWMKYEYSDKELVLQQSGGIGVDIGGTILWWKLPLDGEKS